MHVEVEPNGDYVTPQQPLSPSEPPEPPPDTRLTSESLSNTDLDEETLILRVTEPQRTGTPEDKQRTNIKDHRSKLQVARKKEMTQRSNTVHKRLPSFPSPLPRDYKCTSPVGGNPYGECRQCRCLYITSCLFKFGAKLPFPGWVVTKPHWAF